MSLILKPYKEVLQLSKEKLNQILVTTKAKQKRKEGELKLAHFEEQILRKQAGIEELCSNIDLDFDDLQEQLDDLAVVERRHRQLEDVLAQLFPSNSKKANKD